MTLDILNDLSNIILGDTLNNIFDVSQNAVENIEKLKTNREMARKENDMSKADEIRDNILSKGFAVQDKPDGSTEVYNRKPYNKLPSK